MMHRRVALALLALSIAAVPAESQSLGDVARQEEARRVAGSKSVKTLSNANLKPGEVSLPAVPSSVEVDAPASCYMSIRLGRCVTADEIVANSIASKPRGNAAFEQKWRQDAESIRSQIESTQRSITTLKGVIGDAGRSASDRKAAEETLGSAQQALADVERQWVTFERLAGNQRIPRSWLEPIPTLTSSQ